MGHRFNLIAVGLLLFCLACAPARAFAEEKSVAVLLSREIQPYVSMVEGVERRLVNFAVERFFLDNNGRPYSLAGGGLKLEPANYDLLIAVGPAALRYLSSSAEKVPLLFGMVLNPQKVLSDSQELPCGVSLNIPIEAQFASIKAQFPWLSRLGVMFDPANNQVWFDRASLIAGDLDLQLVPLQVKRIAGRLSIVGDFSLPDAILFIPDQSIISKAVIQYVIKQAVLQQTPVVGYNQYFNDSGASLSFVIDYGEVGRQVAAQAVEILDGGQCRSVQAPVFEPLINEDVWRALRLDRKGGER